MRRIATLTLVLTLLVVVGAVIAARTHRRVDHADLTPEPTADSSDLNALRAELAQTRAIALLAASRADSLARSVQPEAPASSAAAASETAKVDPPPLTFEAQRDQLATRFAQEPRDDSWSERAHEQVTKIATASLPTGSRVVSVECRRSLCRMEAAHEDAAAHRAFVNALVTPGPSRWPGALLATLDETAGAESVIFLERDMDQ